MQRPRCLLLGLPRKPGQRLGRGLGLSAFPIALSSWPAPIVGHDATPETQTMKLSCGTDAIGRFCCKSRLRQALKAEFFNDIRQKRSFPPSQRLTPSRTSRPTQYGVGVTSRSPLDRKVLGCRHRLTCPSEIPGEAANSLLIMSQPRRLGLINHRWSDAFMELW
jgi:hypothetical protein